MGVGFWVLLWIFILSFGIGFIAILLHLFLEFCLSISERRRSDKESRRSDEE